MGTNSRRGLDPLPIGKIIVRAVISRPNSRLADIIEDTGIGITLITSSVQWLLDERLLVTNPDVYPRQVEATEEGEYKLSTNWNGLKSVASSFEKSVTEFCKLTRRFCDLTINRDKVIGEAGDKRMRPVSDEFGLAVLDAVSNVYNASASRIVSRTSISRTCTAKWLRILIANEIIRTYKLPVNVTGHTLTDKGLKLSKSDWNGTENTIGLKAV